MRTRIKLFYRPISLKISPDTAFSSIRYNYDSANQAITLSNPSPYFVTVTRADFKTKTQAVSYTADAVMLEPFSQQTLSKFQMKFKPDQMTYTIINDLGGNQTFDVK